MGSSFERENSDRGAGPAKSGKPPGQVKPRSEGGASVVVGARESRAQGKGRQEKRADAKPLERAMYVANQAVKDWLQNEQGKLHKRGLEAPSYVFRKLWGLVTDPRNLRIALARVASNRGRRTPGVDGVTVRTVLRKQDNRGTSRPANPDRERSGLQWETRPAFVKLSGEPGAQRKVHAGFGRGRPE